MNYAILGLGFIYPRHKQSIEATGGRILLTCDTDVNKNPDFTDWLEMYNSPDFMDVDAVVICTPNYLHTAMAREALLRGKKVLCEKPLSINGTENLEGVNTVLQLRYHPAIKDRKAQSAEVTAKMFRDGTYWAGWKGNKIKSGGFLYNLGIHYIDLLIYLLGEPVRINNASLTSNLAQGEVLFERGIGRYHIEVLDTREGQLRKILIDGEEVELSSKDNLSYEDLHKNVYENFIKGEGIPLSEARKSLNLVDQLLKYGKDN